MITTAAGTYSSTSVSTRVRQRKQARMKEQVKCCREPAMYENFINVSFTPHSFFVVPSFRLYIVRKANRQQQLIWIFPSAGDAQPCDAAVQTISFLVWISV